MTLSYDGTDYHGFQDQGEKLPTIQRLFEDAVEKLTGERLRVIAAGRTDAGVHALGQVVNLRTGSNIPVDRWPYALNSVLPADIVVTGASLVEHDFHARYWAREKTYRYTIMNGPFPSVFCRHYAYHVRGCLYAEAMASAAGLLIGRRDFSAFRGIGGSTTSNIRTLKALRVEASGDTIQIIARGDGFLYHMVRIIVGTLLEVGRGRQSPDWVATVLESKNRALAGVTAPPQGLCLMQVKYHGEKDRTRKAGETTA